MAKKNPLISVVIPSYNHALFIAKAINSVLTQNYRPLELIIIDDGSTDQSAEIIENELKKWKTGAALKINFTRQDNKGAHHTINLGLNKATGDLLTILNSDDYYLPGRLALLTQAILKERSQLAFSYVRHVDENDEPVMHENVMKKWYDLDIARKDLPSVGYRLLKSNIAVTTGNLFFTRRLFKVLGGFRDFKLMHDYDFILRSLIHTEPLLIKKQLLAYRAHGQNACLSSAHLFDIEGPRVAFDFIMQYILNPKPKNKLAPCSANWSGYGKFWQEEISWVGRWLGNADMSKIC